MENTKLDKLAKREVDALVKSFNEAALDLWLKDSELTYAQKAVIILRAASAIHMNQVIRLGQGSKELLESYVFEEKKAKMLSKPKTKTKLTH
jgi:hypothetical protein